MSFLNGIWIKVAAVGAIAVALYVFLLVGQVNHLKTTVVAQQRELVVAHAQIALDAQTAVRQDALIQTQHQIEARLQNALHHIQQSVGANQLVPPDVATAWYAGITELRSDAQTTSVAGHDLIGVVDLPPAYDSSEKWFDRRAIG